MGRLCSGGFSFISENVIFAAYFILRVRDTHIVFLRLLFLVGVICPLMQEHSLRLIKLNSQVPEDAMLKISLNQIACYVPTEKSDVSQTCQQSVFSPIGACIRMWCTADAVERRPQMFVYRLSPFPFPHLAIFTLFPQTERLLTDYNN